MPALAHATTVLWDTPSLRAASEVRTSVMVDLGDSVVTVRITPISCDWGTPEPMAEFIYKRPKALKVP